MLTMKIEDKERTEETMRLFNNENGEELTHLFLKSDVILLVDVFEKYIKILKYQLKTLILIIYIVQVCRVVLTDAD